MILFCIQGCGIGTYEICGNQIILKLWNGISNSPVNAMHSGYGIGAIAAVQILRSYIKFNPILKINENYNNTANTTEIINMQKSSDINLVIPYTIGSCFGIGIVIGFLIAQYFESKVTKKYEKETVDQIIFSPLSLNKATLLNKENNHLRSHQKINFGRHLQSKTSFVALVLITSLLFLLFMFANGTITIINTYMLTYLVNGPAKFDISTFIQLQTLYWAFQISGRVTAAFCGFKMNSLIFFLILTLIQLLFLIIYSIPTLNSHQIFYWILIPSIGFALGPLIPSCFMISKYLYKNVNTFLLSILLIGTKLGNMLSQYITGLILDKFKFKSELNFISFYYSSSMNSKYLIPFVALSFIAISAILYILILIVYQFSKKNK